MGAGATSRRNMIINYGRYRPHRIRERFSQLVCYTSVPTLSRLPGKQYLRSSAFTQSGPRSPTWRSTDETLEAEEVKSEHALRRLLTGGGVTGYASEHLLLRFQGPSIAVWLANASEENSL